MLAYWRHHMADDVARPSNETPRVHPCDPLDSIRRYLCNRPPAEIIEFVCRSGLFMLGAIHSLCLLEVPVMIRLRRTGSVEARTASKCCVFVLTSTWIARMMTARLLVECSVFVVIKQVDHLIVILARGKGLSWSRSSTKTAK